MPVIYPPHGFLLSKKGVLSTIDFPGAFVTTAVGINASGDIVGVYRDTTGVHGYSLSKSNVFTPIDVPGSFDTRAFGINSSGAIVGDYVDATGRHGFLLSR